MAESKMLSLFDQLQDLMIQNHFRPEKKLSQFFCINEALLQFLVNRATLKEGDVVLEIGPGTGFLTRILLNRTKKAGARVVAIEFDETMYALLYKLFSEEITKGELTLILGDALEQDLELLKINKVVSLPPYHISSALLSKLTLSKGIEKAVHHMIEQEQITHPSDVFNMKDVELQYLDQAVLSKKIQKLEKEMTQLAQNMEFEKAAVVRDQLMAIKKHLMD